MNTWKCTLCSTTCIRPRHLQREHYQDCSTLVSFYYGLREVILDGRGYRSNLQIVSDRRGVGSSVWINALVDASWRWKAILLIAVMKNISSTQRSSIATFHRSIQLFYSSLQHKYNWVYLAALQHSQAINAQPTG